MTLLGIELGSTKNESEGGNGGTASGCLVNWVFGKIEGKELEGGKTAVGVGNKFATWR